MDHGVWDPYVYVAYWAPMMQRKLKDSHFKTADSLQSPDRLSEYVSLPHYQCNLEVRLGYMEL